MKSFRIELVSQIIAVSIITLIAGYALFGITRMEANREESQTGRIEELIDKALVACYALEGSYPSEEQFKEKMIKYGIAINEDKYIYHYEIFANNVKPVVQVIAKP